MKPFGERLTEATQDLVPASGARDAYRHILAVLQAQLPHMHKEVWDKRISDDTYHDLRSRYYQLNEDIQVVKALLDIHDGIRPQEPIRPLIRKPDRNATGY